MVSKIGRRLNSSWTCESLKVLKTFGWGVRGAPQKFHKFCKQKKYTAVFYAAYAYGDRNGEFFFTGQLEIVARSSPEIQLFVGVPFSPHSPKRGPLFWHIVCFEKNPAEQQDGIWAKTSVQSTEELRILEGFQNYGAGGLAQFLRIFQKRAKIKDLENFRFFSFVLWEVMFSGPLIQWGTFWGYKFWLKFVSFFPL